METPQTFELEFNGKTFVTKKLDPVLRGKANRANAYVAKEMHGYTQEEAEKLEWLQAAVAGAIFEHITPLIWEFIRDDDKSKIGTKAQLIENLSADQIVKFFGWLGQVLQENADFFGGNQGKTAQQSSSEASMPLSPVATAGHMDSAQS